MGTDLNFLITLSNGDTLLRVAMKSKQDQFTGDATTYPLEPENRAQFFKMLPLHVQSFGNIVDIDSIFEIQDNTRA